MGDLITVRDLRYRYPDGTPALQGVDFHLGPGETVILFGANGSGKTTFCLHLNGLLRGDGEIVVCGMPLADGNVKTIRRKVGMVFQQAEEQLFMPTVVEDVAYGLLNQGCGAAEAKTKAEAALESVGMGHCPGKAPYHLSSGEKKRVALAGVLVMEPELIVLDEPTTSLDPPGRGELMALLRGLPQAKVVATHDTAFARAIGTRAVFFEKGRIAGAGAVEELVQKYDWE